MPSPEPEIIVVKKKSGHGGAHHGGAWKVAYADFVTAMMAFFLVMWIVGLSQEIKQSVSGYFSDPEAFMEGSKRGDKPFDLGSPGKPPVPPAAEESAERDLLKKAKESLEKTIGGSPEFSDVKQHIEIRMADEGLRIDLVESRESMFFDSASAQVKPRTRAVLACIAKELSKLSNQVIIEGHTDARPVARAAGYTNWELSSDRANSARRIMEQTGLSQKRIVQIRGYAATHPRNKDPNHFTNRRVSIVVVMKNALRREMDPSGA